MKKIGLLLLVLVMAFGVTGCSKDKDADPVGTWTFILDDGCNGADLAMVVHVFSNGTFIIDGGVNGTWSVDGDDITLNINVGYYILSGTVDGAGMNGTYVGASAGCWNAVRTSTAP